MKKLYSLKESTIEIIKSLAVKNDIPESFALDFIVENWDRMINGKKKKTALENWNMTDYWDNIKNERDQK